MQAKQPNIVTQPHLGVTSPNTQPHLDMNMLAWAKVTRVHHKHSTADVEVINTRDVISSDPAVEGKFAARISTVSAHYDNELMLSSGVIEPIQEGSIVLLAFLDGNKSRPVILGSFHYPDSVDKNVLPNQYPIHENTSLEERKEALKYLRVFPSQLYHRVDGEGGVEVSHPSKTFLKVDVDAYEDISDSHDGFDHEDLVEKDPHTYDTRSGHTEASVMPVKFLFVHRSSFMSNLTKWLKIFIDRTGLFRITKDNNDGKLSYVEMGDDGSITIRRQNSSSHGQGTASEITISSTNEVTINQDSGTYIEMSSNGDIKISAVGKLSANCTGDVDLTSTQGNVNLVSSPTGAVTANGRIIS